MEKKQRTYEGAFSYNDCEKFVDAMDTIYDIYKVIFEKIPHKCDWVIKWRVIVSYKEKWH